MTFSGTLKSRRKNSAPKIPMNDMMPVSMPATQISAVTVFASLSLLPQPKHCATTSPAPLHMPLTNASRK